MRNHTYYIDMSDVTRNPQLFIELSYRLSQRSINFVGLPLKHEEIFVNMRLSEEFGIMDEICWLLIFQMRPLVRKSLIWKD